MTLDHEETARALVARVKLAFEDGYDPGKLVRYEQNAIAGFSADEVFFGTMIYKSVLKNLRAGNLPKNEPEPPARAKKAATAHGRAAAADQSKEPLRLGTILKSFYKIKAEHCPLPPSDKGELLGFVCDI
jgi:hypothetical protein